MELRTSQKKCFCARKEKSILDDMSAIKGQLDRIKDAYNKPDPPWTIPQMDREIYRMESALLALERELNDLWTKPHRWKRHNVSHRKGLL
jgi:hypothetical protein